MPSTCQRGGKNAWKGTEAKEVLSGTYARCLSRMEKAVFYPPSHAKRSDFEGFLSQWQPKDKTGWNIIFRDNLYAKSFWLQRPESPSSSPSSVSGVKR